MASKEFGPAFSPGHDKNSDDGHEHEHDSGRKPGQEQRNEEYHDRLSKSGLRALDQSRKGHDHEYDSWAQD